MPRRRRLRKVVAPPGFRGYKPYGNVWSKADAVELLYEEYEAIKLADYDLMNHQEAAELMGVSRPTFARIYETARRKIARALVETREIKTTYGNAVLDKDWHVCDDCLVRFTVTKQSVDYCCPLCKSENVHSLKGSGKQIEKR